MRQLSEVLAGVLADVEARISQKEKGDPICGAAVFALGCKREVASAEKVAGGSAVRFNVPAEPFAADTMAPAGHVVRPETAGGDKRKDVCPAESSSGVIHDLIPQPATAQAIPKRTS